MCQVSGEKIIDCRSNDVHPFQELKLDYIKKIYQTRRHIKKQNIPQKKTRKHAAEESNGTLSSSSSSSSSSFSSSSSSPPTTTSKTFQLIVMCCIGILHFLRMQITRAGKMWKVHSLEHLN